MATADQLYKEGQALFNQKKYDEALAKYREAHEADKDDVIPMHAMVQAYTELERHEEAIEMAKKLTEIEPDDHFAFIGLSRAYQRAGMIPEAEMAMAQGQQVQMRAAGG